MDNRRREIEDSPLEKAPYLEPGVIRREEYSQLLI